MRRNTTGTTFRGSRRSWKRLVLPIVVVGALAFAGFAFSGAMTVTLTKAGGQPALVTVNWGDTVMFVNGDTISHGVTASREELNSHGNNIPPGQTFTTVLTGRTATYPYRMTSGSDRGRPAGAIASQVVGSVSMKASATQLAYGKSVTFSGISTFHNSPVALLRRQRGERGFTEIKELTSATDTGAYSVTITPTIGGLYGATVAGGQVDSALAKVDVLPRLTITSQARKTRAGHTINIYTRVTPAASASYVTLIECNVTRGAETLAGRKIVHKGGGVKFSWRAEQGKTVLRAVVAHHDSTPGYLAPESRKISVVGVGAPPKKTKHHRPRIKSC